jgi:hypothetical protein
LERQVDIETIGDDWEKYFIRMMNHFKRVHEWFANSEIQCLQKVLISMFNMIGTLVTNCEKISNNLVNSLDYFITAISNSEVLQNENIEKFLDYFGSKTACDQFRSDFYEIDDKDKNDTLYFDVDEDSHNQYFVILTIKQASVNPSEAIEQKWSDYNCEKAKRIIAYCKLRKLLRLKVKNFLLKLKTEKMVNVVTDLAMEHYNWISLDDDGDIRQIINAVSQEQVTFELIDELYKNQRILMNILSNHYSIRNSLDTHFVVNKLNEVNRVLNETRKTFTKKMTEIYVQNVSNNYKISARKARTMKASIPSSK